MPEKYTLGLDLGSASIGWAIIGIDNDEPKKIIRAGVRIFDPGVEGNLEQGREESKNKNRRMARLHRRQLRRKAGRQRELFRTLQNHGLLPANPSGVTGVGSQTRHQVMEELDKHLRDKWLTNSETLKQKYPATEHVLPYVLRAEALDEKLELHELGRVLYHMSQRRGYKSNRLEEVKEEDEKEQGAVKSGITELSKEMAESGARTLGEHFAQLNPALEKIRRRWTSRAMFLREFEMIWAAQAKHHDKILTPELKEKTHWLLFFQRPLMSSAKLIGECELEPGQKRAPMASLEAQRFRLLQKVNDLKICFDAYTETPLTKEQRAQLLNRLENDGDIKFTELRVLFGLPKRGVKFNLERGGESKIPGNQTNKAVSEAFGETWQRLSADEKTSAVNDWSKAETTEQIIETFTTKWKLPDIPSRKLAETHPESKYLSISIKALKRILPLMEEGALFKTAETQIYGDRFSGSTPEEILRPVKEVIKELRNPAVERAMTELRKVVNAILREQEKKPHEIRIELARDLKRGRKERQDMWEKSRERQKERKSIEGKILQECGIQVPSRSDTEKALLFKECGGNCPYCGKPMEFRSLFSAGEIQVEHILPLSRFPDDSFGNKTLCHQACNIEKHNRTPWEAFGANDEEWGKIVERVKKFGNKSKLERFLIKDSSTLEEFSSRRLNDTRYISTLAARYLATLYGGRDIATEDNKKRRVIHSSSGMATATLRRNWGLETILREAVPSANGESKGKPRTDHRHHAVDAIVIALTTNSAIKGLSTASQFDGAGKWRPFKSLQAPWKDFVDAVRLHIQNMVVSHRPNHKMSGPLHEETNYGKPRKYEGKQYCHIRKPVHALGENEAKNIVDEAVKKAVFAKVGQFGGDFKKLENDWPVLPTKDGNGMPIRSVRFRKVMQTVTTVGREERERFVSLSNNHHTSIFAELDTNGNEKRWTGFPISLYEAAERQRNAKKKKQFGSIVQRSLPNESDQVFKFSLMGGDIIELTGKDGGKDRTGLWRVRTIATNEQFALVKINDARLLKDVGTSGDSWKPRADAFRKLNCQKVVVDILGKIHSAHD